MHTQKLFKKYEIQSAITLMWYGLIEMRKIS